MAGFMLWFVKLRYGRERAAASVLDVKVEEADEAVVLMVFVLVLGVSPTDPDTLSVCPCLGACCFFSCKALASAFSCVLTN